MRLVTPRLTLRRFRAEDAPAFAAYRSDPQVARYQTWTAPVPLTAAAELVQEYATGDPQVPGWFQYAVELTDEHTLIGDVGVDMADNLMQVEIGFSLATAYQGQGYGSEAVRRIIEELFAERGLHRISAECDARNTSSARLLERVGFRREGYLVSNTWLKGEWTDDLLFGLLAEDWAAARRDGSG